MIGPSAVGAPPPARWEPGCLLPPGYRGVGASPTPLAVRRAEALCRRVKQNDQSQSVDMSGMPQAGVRLAHAVERIAMPTLDYPTKSLSPISGVVNS
jgi:hypothetical protein